MREARLGCLGGQRVDPHPLRKRQERLLGSRCELCRKVEDGRAFQAKKEACAKGCQGW